MSRKQELHGAALYRSKYCSFVTLWLYNNPRMTPSKVRDLLIDKFGPEASFSEPHIRAFMKNYYPEIYNAAISTGEGGFVAVASLTESKLFGSVVDPMDYHQLMIGLLETKFKEAEEEYNVIRDRLVDKTTPAEDVVKIGTTVVKLRDQMTKLSREIREYKKYADEWQRTFDFGDKMGDLIYRMTELIVSIIYPEVTSDRLFTVRDEFTIARRQLAREFKVPPEKLG